MGKSKDLFDDTTMSFGEHLEILRTHLWKAIVGLAVCVVFALFFGNKVVDVVRRPIDKALQRYGMSTRDDIGGFNFTEWLKNVAAGGTTNAADGSRITDRGLTHLADLDSLEQLGLTATGVTADGLRDLKEALPQLQTTVDPLALAGLSQLKDRKARCRLDDDFQVVSLVLRGAEFSDADLKLLKNRGSLKQLDLQRAEVTDDGLAYLAGLTGLEYLNLTGTQITDDGLESLQRLTALQHLDLRRTAVTDDGLRYLKELRNLERLDLTATEVTDAGLKHLKGLKNLAALFLSGPEITDEGLKHLSGLTRLERLEFMQTAVSDAGLKHLKKLGRLRVLNFTEGPAPGDSSSENLSPEMIEGGTIAVRVRASDLAATLHNIDPETYPDPPDAAEERWVSLPITAPEFRDFRETAVNFRKPVTLNVQEAFLTYLKVAVVAGLLIASPWMFYQIWLFVAAGLYPHERRYVYTYLPISTLLFIGGAVFCFFAVFPFVLNFLLGFNEWLGVTPQIRLSEWISFAIILPLMFGISFQLPLVMLFLERISIFEVSDYREKRRMAILVIAILSMLLTPADPMSMMMMMVPMVALYELGILLCSFSPVKSPFEAEAA